MTTTVGQQAVYRLASSRYVQAIVTKIVSGDTVELVAFSDGSAWGDGDPASLGAKVYDSIALGTAVGEWQPGTLVSDAIAAATTNKATYSYVDSAVAPLATSASVTAAIATAEAYTDTAIAGLPADDDSGLVAVPSAGSPITLAFATPRRPSTTRPTRVTISGHVAMTSTLLGPQSATITLLADSGSTPSTTVGVQVTGLSGVAATSTVPFVLTYDLPTGHYYQVTTSLSANATPTIDHINEQVM